MSAVTLDLERQKQARNYARIRRRLWLVDTGLSAVFVLVWLLTGWSLDLRNWLTGITTDEWALVALFALILGGSAYLLDLPLSYYAGFVLPHRFGQSTQTLKGWVSDRLKGMLISGILGLGLLEIIYLLLRLYPDTWWLWAGLVILFFTVLLFNLSPVLIMPLFNKFVPLSEEHRDLAERLIRLADRAHTKVRGVFKLDMSRRTKSANAALAGIGSTRRIVLGDTLIQEFTPEEIETVLAHELGHHVHRDIPILIACGTLLTLGGLYLASLGLRWGIEAFGYSGAADIAGLPLFMLVVGAFELVTQPLSNAFSRWRERMADRYALRMTGRQEAFASAFTRLANQNLSEVDPEKWVVFMFYDHPPLGERIAAASSWKP